MAQDIICYKGEETYEPKFNADKMPIISPRPLSAPDESGETAAKSPRISVAIARRRRGDTL
jgi:hypothetical protein